MTNDDRSDAAIPHEPRALVSGLLTTRGGRHSQGPQIREPMYMMDSLQCSVMHEQIAQRRGRP